MFEQCRWLNEPFEWSVGADQLLVVTNHGTDFWRETHYGFTRDNGHFFGRETEGAFTATLRIRARYEKLYDQAGIMVRLDQETWIKGGIELSDGEALLGSVLTLGRSDWATGPFRGNASDFWIKVTVNRGVLRLQASVDGLRWPLVRLCPFPPAGRYLVGPMCCTPERAGLKVVFSDFNVTPPTDKALHDLT
jgi:regulation of enolase protein 1 (concanavalin A-like superfamily)